LGVEHGVVREGHPGAEVGRGEPRVAHDGPGGRLDEQAGVADRRDTHCSLLVQIFTSPGGAPRAVRALPTYRGRRWSFRPERASRYGFGHTDRDAGGDPRPGEDGTAPMQTERADEAGAL